MRKVSASMGVTKRIAAALFVLIGALALPFAAPASAEPANDPCSLAVTLLCRFVPIAPDLEGDVDYTQQQTGIDVLAPEAGHPVDPCVSGCI